MMKRYFQNKPKRLRIRKPRVSPLTFDEYEEEEEDTTPPPRAGEGE